MKRPMKNEKGVYVIHGKSYPLLIGSRRQVWNGNAYKTAGELTKSQLHFNNKTQRIVSLKKHESAKKEKRLEKAGYFTRKGKFGYVKKTARKSRKSRKLRGGGDTPEEKEEPKEEPMDLLKT